MVNRGSEFKFLQGIHVRIDVRIDISISIRPMTIKFGKQLHLQNLTITRLIKQVLVTSLRRDHQSTRVPMATTRGMMVTYLEWILPIKSDDPLITWYFQIT